MGVRTVLLVACMNATQTEMDEAVKNTKLAAAALEVDNFEKTRELLALVQMYLSNAKAMTSAEDGKVHPEKGVFDRRARASFAGAHASAGCSARGTRRAGSARRRPSKGRSAATVRPTAPRASTASVSNA